MVEKKLNIKKPSVIALKLPRRGYAWMPDHMVLLLGGRLCFVDVKAPGKVPRPLQAARHRVLQEMGFLVFVLEDPSQIDGVIEEALAWQM